MTPSGQNLQGRVIRGGMVLAGGQVLGQAMSFARNMIVAGILSKGEFGIASFFALTLSVFEMLSDMAVDKLLVQAKDGEDARLQGATQAYQFVRGVVSGAVIFVCGGLIANLFHEPDTAWAFRTLAILPVVRGLMHLDVRRVQRSLRFGPSTWVFVVPQCVTAIAAWPLTTWIGNYSAVLWLILAQSVLMSLLSHVVATRRYAWSWDVVLFRRIFGFGWPLLMNGLLLLGILHGDRMLIATFLTIQDMGVFSLALLMAMTPMTLLAKVLGDMMLPICSKPVAEPELQDRYTRLMRVYIMVAMMFAIGAIGLSEPVLRGLYGMKYVEAIIVLQWLGAANAIRLIRMGVVLQSIANGDTLTSMWSSSVRLIGLPLAALVIYEGRGLEWVSMCACAGEGAALVPMIIRLRRIHTLDSLPLATLFGFAITTAAGIALVTILTDSMLVQMTVTLASVSGAAIAAVVFGNQFLRTESTSWSDSNPIHQSRSPQRDDASSALATQDREHPLAMDESQ